MHRMPLWGGLFTLLAVLAGCKQTTDHIDTDVLSVGDFRLQLADNQLSVWHRSEPDLQLLQTPADGRLLSAAITTLNVRDSRSTYRIDEQVQKRCVRPSIQQQTAQDDGLAFTGRFLDCPALAFEWRFAVVDGQLQFTLTTDDATYNHLSLHYRSSADEHFYGFGEQYSYLDLKGQNIPVLTQEQGIGRGEPLLSSLINLYAPGSAGTPLTSYYAVPQYITSARRSVFLEGVEYARFDLREPLQVSVHQFAGHMTGRILYGQDLLALIEGFTRYSGRMAPLPEWMNRGAILGLQGGAERVRQLWQTLQAADTPIAALWLQDWVGKRTTLGGAGSQLWWNWELDQQQYPDWQSLQQDLAAADVRVMGYINPFLVDVSSKANVERNLYQEALAQDFLVKQRDGTPYPILITDFAAGIVDLTNPAAREWLKSIIRDNLIGNGFSGWMADFGEALPFEAELFNGQSGERFHNEYPVEWARLNAEAVAEAGLTGDINFFMRSGFTQSPRYSTLFWLGDQATTYDRFDGLTSAVIGLLNGGFSGISLNHSDIGGYTSLTLYGIGLKRSQELLLRWIEANAFTAVYRTHEGLAPQANVQVYSNTTTVEQFARFARIYAALADYRQTLMGDVAQRGYPVVRHPVLHYPEDTFFRAMPPSQVQYLLGADLMVAPVLLPNATSRSVHLPAGRWIHVWSGQAIDAPAHGIDLQVSAPIGEPPVYVRADSEWAPELLDRLQRERRS